MREQKTGPETWVRYDLENETCMGEPWLSMNEQPNGDWIKYAPVEQFLEKVKAYLVAATKYHDPRCQMAMVEDGNPCCCGYAQARRLLDAWPVKEG